MGICLIFFRSFLSVNNCAISVLCQDLKSQPFSNESPPLTTRPRLPAIYKGIQVGNVGNGSTSTFLVFLSVNNKHFYMAGFEPRSSVVFSDHSANCTIITALSGNCLHVKFVSSGRTYSAI